jgi:serine/threonine-protein kinase
VLVKDPARRYGTGGELAMAIAAVRRGDPLPIPGVPQQAGSSALRAVDETGETVYPRRSAGPLSGPVPSVPASRSPISSPERVRPVDSPATGSPPTGVPSAPVRAVPGTRPAVSPAPPTEPLRIPPARGPDRGLLLVLFVLLTLAAVALGVYLLGGGLGDTAGAAAASTVIVAPVAGSVAVRDAAAPGEPRRNRHR